MQKDRLDDQVDDQSASDEESDGKASDSALRRTGIGTDPGTAPVGLLGAVRHIQHPVTALDLQAARLAQLRSAQSAMK
jgi:hypothetical protein